MSEIRTDDRYPDDDELGPTTPHKYIADSSSDEVSSEDSFFSPAVQGHVNSTLLMMLATAFRTLLQFQRQRTQRLLGWVLTMWMGYLQQLQTIAR
jgi:hypothetical protein